MSKLFSERERERLLRDAEGRGETVWTRVFDTPQRLKLWYALEDSISVIPAASSYMHPREIIVSIMIWHLRRSYGVPRLALGATSDDELYAWLLSCPDSQMPDFVEVTLARGMASNAGLVERGLEIARLVFLRTVNDVLLSARIAYQLIDEHMVPLDSLELHDSVVAPTLTLLGGRKGLEAAESAYQEALDEIARSKPDDAITDAGRALEEALKALGCKGNSLGPRIDSARAMGLIAPHDNPLLLAISKAYDWASSDRSETGDAHTSATTDINDAWLTVHVIGALVVRLVQGPRR